MKSDEGVIYSKWVSAFHKGPYGINYRGFTELTITKSQLRVDTLFLFRIFSCNLSDIKKVEIEPWLIGRRVCITYLENGIEKKIYAYAGVLNDSENDQILEAINRARKASPKRKN